MRLVLPAVLAGLVAFAPSHAQDSRAAGVVSGIVLDATGAGVPGATVQLRSGARDERSAASDDRGEFRFEKLLPGQYEIRVAKTGFDPLARSVDVVLDRPAFIRLTLSATGAASQAAANDAFRARSADRSSVPPNAAPVEAPRAKADSERAPDMRTAAPPPPPGAPALVPGAGGGRGGHSILSGIIPDHDTEAYDRIDENRFRRVAEDPLSTFSIDVDTASYANVRRFLNQGRLPPADAVRIEELINYFRFDYSHRDREAPFSITTEVAACPWNPRHKLALIGLQAQRLSLERTPPRNLVFLLDVSGSMAPPNKLPLVKTAMRMLADTLTAADRVAIVVYAGASGLALPSTSGHRKPEIQQAIAELRAGGSTNGAAGIRLAYDVASDAFITNGINRVILATDGDFNVGVTSQNELVRLIEAKRERGIFLSVLGVGTGNLKDATMEKLADHGNGNYAYLDSLQEAQRVLIAEAGATLATVAKDVKIQVEFNPRTVGAYKLIGYENRILRHRDFNNDRKDAGDIGAGHTVTALYEIVPPGESIHGSIDPLKYQDRPVQERTYPNAASRSTELMTVKLRYKQPDGDVSKLMTRAVLDRAGVLTPNIGFAAAVAEFGMLLRNSDFRGGATWASAQELARRHRGEDPDGYRAEFIRMIDLAAALDRRGTGLDRER
jgi:Ca-activated chloride channel homolog